MADKDFDNKIVKLPGSSDKPINTGKPANRQPARDIIRTKFIESATEKGFNSLMGFLIKFVIFLVIFVLLWIILSRFNIGVYTPLVSFLLAILFIYLWFKPQGSGGGGGKGGPVIVQGGAPGARHGLPIGKILLVLVLALVIFWLYQANAEGSISLTGVGSSASEFGIKTISFLKNPFKGFQDYAENIGRWNKPSAAEVKEVGIKISDIGKADYYKSEKPIRINGKIKIFGLEDSDVSVEIGCVLKEGDKQLGHGLITVADNKGQETAKINVEQGKDVEYIFLCEFREGVKVDKEQKGFDVFITAKYPNFRRKERLSVETIEGFTAGVSREIGSECIAGCGYYGGPVRLDLSTSKQPLTKLISSLYPMFIKLKNIKDKWSGGVTQIHTLSIGFHDFKPNIDLCDNFDISDNVATLKESKKQEIIKSPSCNFEDVVKKFSSFDDCIETARDQIDYDCWFEVPDEEFVEGSIPKKHYITAQLIFDYEFKSSASIVVRV